jgi:hypothetical protein
LLQDGAVLTDEIIFRAQDMSLLTSTLTARQAGGPDVPTTPEEDLEDNTASLLAIVGTLYGLALLAMLMRAWVRIRMIKAFGVQQYISFTARPTAD